jgi:hypothetical protein
VAITEILFTSGNAERLCLTVKGTVFVISEGIHLPDSLHILVSYDASPSAVSNPDLHFTTARRQNCDISKTCAPVVCVVTCVVLQNCLLFANSAAAANTGLD